MLTAFLLLSAPQDLAELEAAVGQHLLPLEQLGGPARALRAFRRLLFLEAGEVEGSPLLKELPRPEVRRLASSPPACPSACTAWARPCASGPGPC